METKRMIEILNKVLPAVEQKTLISQYDHFVFSKNLVSTYNGKIFFSHPIALDLDCSVKATDMLNVLNTIDSEEVQLEIEGNNLIVSSDDVNATLSTEVHEASVVQAVASMNIDNIAKADVLKVPDDFILGLSDCLFSVSKDANDIRNLHNVHVIENVIESGDGYRCSEYIMESDMKEMLIPSSSANILIKFDPINYILDNGWVHFTDADDVVFSSRLGEGSFPNVGETIERADGKTHQVELPDKLYDILGQFSSLSGGEMDVYKFVKIEIDEKGVTCSTHKDGCNIEKWIDHEYTEPLSFQISPIFLASIMDRTTYIHVTEDSTMAVFKVENFTHLIALLVD